MLQNEPVGLLHTLHPHFTVDIKGFYPAESTEPGNHTVAHLIEDVDLKMRLSGGFDKMLSSLVVLAKKEMFKE